MNFVSIIGAITGCISLVLIIYTMGVWKGSVDTKLKTLWDVYILDALHDRPDLAHHSSSYSLTPQGSELIPPVIKELLNQIGPKELGSEPPGWLVVKTLGINSIEQMATTKSLTIRQSIGVLSTYLITRRDGHPPG